MANRHRPNTGSDGVSRQPSIATIDTPPAATIARRSPSRAASAPAGTSPDELPDAEQRHEQARRARGGAEVERGDRDHRGDGAVADLEDHGGQVDRRGHRPQRRWAAVEGHRVPRLPLV